MKFILDGEPIPQCRHRTFRRKGRNINFDPLCEKKKITKMYMGRIVMNDPYLPYKDFYHIGCVFLFEIPKSDSKAKRKAKLEGLTQHTQVPDCDNLCKYYLDCMNGVLFSDDKKVVKLNCEKKWAEKGHVEIEINGFNYEKKDES